MSEQCGEYKLEREISRALQFRAAAQSQAVDGLRMPAGPGVIVTGIVLALLQPLPLAALSLGDLQVDSSLGQPLRSTAMVSLGPGERIGPDCLMAPPPAGSQALPYPSELQLLSGNVTGPGQFPVEIRTRRPLYEPMYEFRFQVRCPGTVAVSRNYTVMLNLPLAAAPVSMQPTSSANPATAPGQVQSPVARTAPGLQPPGTASTVRPVTAGPAALTPSVDGIAAGSLYRVRSGDTLSTIAARVEGRQPNSIWSLTARLFADNPDAFLRNDPDRLKLGSVLQIPTANELANLAAGNAAGSAPLPATPSARASAPAPARPAAMVAGTVAGRPEENGVAAQPAASTTALAAPLPESPLTIAELSPLPETDSVRPMESLPGMEPADAVWAPASAAGSANFDPFATPVETAAPADASVQAQAETAATPAPAEADTVVPTLLAIGAGIVIGLLLSLLLLGRDLLTGLRRRQVVPVTATEAPGTRPEPLREALTSHAVSSTPTAIDPGATSALRYKSGGIDVEVSTAEFTADIAPEQQPADIDISDPWDATSPPSPISAPRVSLRSSDTGFDPASLLPGDDLLSDFPMASHEPAIAPDESATLRQMFETPINALGDSEDAHDGITHELDTGSESMTLELPEIQADGVIADNRGDIETLSRQLANVDDERLSATLTQALELLEQDYEEEFSASQLISREQADEALGKRKRS